MHKSVSLSTPRPLASALALSLSLGMLGGPLGGTAQAAPLVQNIPTVTGKIDYVAIGGSFRRNNGDSGAGGYPTNVPLTTDQASAVYTTATTKLSDRNQYQVVPAGATVERAFLYWSASEDSDAYDSSVTFGVGGSSFPVTATRSWTDSASTSWGNIYGMSAYTELTGAALTALKTNPNSDLSLSNLTIGRSPDWTAYKFGTVFGNWSLYIVYSKPEYSTKSLFLYDGGQWVVDGTTTATVSATNLSVPDAGISKVSKISVAVSEGDPMYNGASNDDRMSITAANNGVIQSSYLSDSYHTSSDFFNGSVTYGVNGGSSWLQSNTSNVYSTQTEVQNGTAKSGGLDFATLDISNNVDPGVDTLSASMSTSSRREVIYLYNLALMTTNTPSGAAPDLRITKTDMAPNKTATVGIPFDFRLGVDLVNTSATEAYKVITTDTLPAGLDFVSAKVSYDGGSTFTAVTPTTNIRNSNGTTTLAFPAVERLDPGGAVYDSTGKRIGTGAVQYLVTVKANSGALGTSSSVTLTNTAKVSTSTSETNLANNVASDIVKIALQPQLTLTKTSNAVGGKWSSGQNDTSYTLTVTNSSAVPTSGMITVQDQLPTGMVPLNPTFSPATGWVCTTFGQLVTCTSTDVLAPGASVALNVPVNIAGVSLGPVINKASVGGGGDPDPLPTPGSCTPAATNPGNQCGSATVTVTGTVKLVVEKTVQNITAGTPVALSSTGKPGDVLEYCIKTTNQGTLGATNLHFGDNVPAATAFLESAYGAGKDIHLTTTTGTDTFYTAAADTDQGAVTSGRVTVDGLTFTLQPKQAFTICFRTTIQ
ncbi:isopeptide-forming domain-containing fimbrial protein [Deinococcus sp.]|uniref:isopeptide-forming domain-containing fimbrial protein n=1 Tax=Deinococcus sp. TaxID=47478 RepID=UPI0025C20249|nr:isopeptide-forming domain-containing fimbrial protein [Deinococcus sp.]